MDGAMKSEILKILTSAQESVSGQKICEDLQVSRTAVWKVMNQLKEEGYVIESVPNKGYRLLAEPQDSIAKEALESHMGTKVLGRCVYFKEAVDSTNLEAKRLAEKGAAHGSLMVAEQQSAGRGRRGRSWRSAPGEGIYMSLLLKPALHPSHAACLTLVAALAVCKGIREHTGLAAGIKWPNDIVVNGHKVCGILTEMSSEADYIRYILVGIGINVNTEEFPEELKEVAGSLYLEGGKKVNRRELICTILKHMEEYYGVFLATGDLYGLVEAYDGFLVNKGREVRVLDGDREKTGVALGIEKDGGLLMKSPEGLEKIVAGEVSVRGLYGYV